MRANLLDVFEGILDMPLILGHVFTSYGISLR